MTEATAETKSELTIEEIISRAIQAGATPTQIEMLASMVRNSSLSQIRELAEAAFAPRKVHKVLIFRPSKTDRSGRKIWAKDYGHRAWPMWVSTQDAYR
jgi:hypothetical protein